MTDIQLLQTVVTLGCCAVTMAYCWRLGYQAGRKSKDRPPVQYKKNIPLFWRVTLNIWE